MPLISSGNFINLLVMLQNFTEHMFPLMGFASTFQNSLTLLQQCIIYNKWVFVTDEVLPQNIIPPMTGGSFDFKRATTSLTDQIISSPKRVTLVRHGLSTWNEESKIQVM